MAFCPLHRSAQRSRSSSSLQASALIIQNKGGGHGELGYQLAQTLQRNDKITSITILQDEACKDSQEPFKSYATDIPNVKVLKAPLADEGMTAESIQKLLGGESVRFDYVWDNASKGADGSGKACVDCARAWDVKLYIYVSSGGVYKPAKDGVFPMPEATTPVKDTAGQVELEKYAMSQGLPFVSFRPQYIYGEKANKHDYLYVLFCLFLRACASCVPCLSVGNSYDAIFDGFHQIHCSYAFHLRLYQGLLF